MLMLMWVVLCVATGGQVALSRDPPDGIPATLLNVPCWSLVWWYSVLYSQHPGMISFSYISGTWSRSRDVSHGKL